MNTAKKCNEMLIIGERWSAALRRRYLFCAAKCIARDFGVDVRTAKNWLAGQAPSAWCYMRAWELFGIDVVVETLSPCPERFKSDTLDEEFEECRRHIAVLREIAMKGLKK